MRSILPSFVNFSSPHAPKAKPVSFAGKHSDAAAQREQAIAAGLQHQDSIALNNRVIFIKKYVELADGKKGKTSQQDRAIGSILKQYDEWRERIARALNEATQYEELKKLYWFLMGQRKELPQLSSSELKHLEKVELPRDIVQEMSGVMLEEVERRK